MLHWFEDVLKLHLWYVANFVGVEVPEQETHYYYKLDKILRSPPATCLPVKITCYGQGEGRSSPDQSLKPWWVIMEGVCVDELVVNYLKKAKLQLLTVFLNGTAAMLAR